jgi:D-beta-D-heptose 7-phosphate kinase/D-beta-D-heptose 1-phosphate adenosyltransferase
MSLDERKAIVAALESVDFVVDFDEDTPIELIEKMQPSLVVKGGDYKVEEVVGYGVVPVEVVSLVDGISTTEKLEKVGKDITIKGMSL